MGGWDVDGAVVGPAVTDVADSDVAVVADEPGVDRAGVEAVAGAEPTDEAAAESEADSVVGDSEVRGSEVGVSPVSSVGERAAGGLESLWAAKAR